MPQEVWVAPPLGSVDPREWNVYLDYLVDGGAGKVTADKAARIKWILEHWAYDVSKYEHFRKDPSIGPPVKKLWLKLGPAWQQTRHQRWNWSMTGATTSLRHVDQQDKFTNPEESELCHGNPWWAMKFFNFLLVGGDNLARVLTQEDLKEYNRLFNKSDIRVDLRAAIKNNWAKLKRVVWTHGERLEIVDWYENDAGIYGNAIFYPEAWQGMIFPHKFPLGLPHPKFFEWRNKHQFDLKDSRPPGTHKIKPLAKDWVPYE